MSISNAGIDDLLAVQRIMVNSASQSGSKQGHHLADGDLKKNHTPLTPSIMSPADDETIIPVPVQTIQVDQESIHLIELIDRLHQIDFELPIHDPSYDQRLIARQFIPETPILPLAPGKASPDDKVVVIPSDNILEVEITFPQTMPMDGLILHDHSKAESDRYLFTFGSRGTEFMIVDKWTKHSTRVWGDYLNPQDEVKENRSDEFIDLKSSSTHTSFMLMDGSRVTFKARENGSIEGVDIIKCGQRIHGMGQASPDWDQSTTMLDPKIMSDGIESDTSIPHGDMIFAGGSGNDWYNAVGKLVWGHTASPKAHHPPSPRIELMMNHAAAESSSIHHIEKSI